MANNDIYTFSNMTISTGPDGDLMWTVKYFLVLIHCLILSKPSWQHNSGIMKEKQQQKFRHQMWCMAFAPYGTWRLQPVRNALRNTLKLKEMPVEKPYIPPPSPDPPPPPCCRAAVLPQCLRVKCARAVSSSLAIFLPPCPLSCSCLLQAPSQLFPLR